MKISKLFHWLYSLVMFLPILFFIPNVLYYGFNEHAVNETTTQVDIQNKYQSNEVNTIDDIVLGNLYLYNNLQFDYQTVDITNEEFYFYVVDFSLDTDYTIFDYPVLEDTSISEVDVKLNIFYFSFTDSGDCYVDISYDGITYYDFSYSNYLFSFDYLILYFDDWTAVNGFSSYVNSYEGINDAVKYLQYTDYNVIESVDVQTDVEQSIIQSMSNGWEQTWNLPIFSWSHNTFFSAPFNYISALFGFQSGNSLSYCLSYWFSISIIWLVFDVMLYVPLLVHRWLDKASIS